MTLAPKPLRFYTQPSDKPPMAWESVERQLVESGLYWVSASTWERYPHPRPVWGVWLDERLYLSIGTPTLRRSVADGRRMTVHLESGLDVVIVEGDPIGNSAAPDVLAAYDTKYDWAYDAETYGPLTVVAPRTVLAWRSAGPSGRDGFQEASRWVASVE